MFRKRNVKAGVHALDLDPSSWRDLVSRVLSGMTNLVMTSLFYHDDNVEMAEYATVLVINGLTD